MGGTKEKVSRPIWLVRLVSAGVLLFVGLIAMAQLLIFPNVTIKFDTGVNAQKIAAVQVKRGGDVLDLPTPMKPGSYFVGWSLSKHSGEVVNDLRRVTRGTTLYAVWDGVEKYGVFMVNGEVYGNINIFKASDDGVSPSELNAKWRIPDDFNNDGQGLLPVTASRSAVLRNNYQRFMGWEYLNAEGTMNQLLYRNGQWSLRQANGEETAITDENLFYPPNYKTTFNAILEYRQINFLFRNYDTSRATIALPSTGSDGELYAPQYPDSLINATQHFSHWQVDYGNLLVYAPAATQAQIKDLSFVPGERIVVDPSWYYLGTEDQFAVEAYGSDNVVVTLVFRATEWNTLTPPPVEEIPDAEVPDAEVLDEDEEETADETTDEEINEDETSGVEVQAVSTEEDNRSDNIVYKYTRQIISDVKAGTKEPMPEADATNPGAVLSVNNPVAFSVANGNEYSLWLYKDDEQQISFYNFIDHEGVIHQISTTKLDSEITEIKLIGPYQVGGEEVTFNINRAVNVAVNYRSALKNIAVTYDYGNELTILPGYNYSTKNVIVEQNMNIGNIMVLPNAEKYLKNDWLFTGWRLENATDFPQYDAERIFWSGEYFTIPHMAGDKIKFTAVWRESRLLFGFEFNGGAWVETPDFQRMKGSYGNRVQVVHDVPVRFGYDFAGWKLGDATVWPGEYIVVGDDINLLRAQWQPKKLQIEFLTKISTTQNVSDVVEIKVGETVALKTKMSNKYYDFLGWQIGAGEKIVPGDDGYDQFVFDVDRILKIDPDPVVVGSTIKIQVHAWQTNKFAKIEYYDGSPDKTLDISGLNWITTIMQGEKFSDYQPEAEGVINPFSLTDAELDMHGREFQKWSFNFDNQRDYVPIVREETIVPAGAETIRIFVTYETKDIIIEYVNYDERVYYYEGGNHFAQKTAGVVDSNYFHWLGDISLPTVETLEGIGLSTVDETWGSFVGWAYVEDNIAGNPDLVYNIRDKKNPYLKVANEDDNNIELNTYLINIDRWAKKQDRVGINVVYKLTLYAVYANDCVRIAYYANDETDDEANLLIAPFETPVYLGSDRDNSLLGGATIGNDAPDCRAYGVMIADETGLTIPAGQNFVGWRMVLPDSARADVKANLENRLWFPGEYLPAVDFDLKFAPIFVDQNKAAATVTLGYDANVRNYTVASFGLVRQTTEVDGAEPQVTYELNPLRFGRVDVVVLPSGEYTVPTETITISGPIKRVVISAQGKITLAPKAIRANYLTDFYVSDNLILLGSPVVGESFQNYMVQAGYYLCENAIRETDNLPIKKRQSAKAPGSVTQKYLDHPDLQGTLIEATTRALVAVPCHTAISTDALYQNLTKFAVTTIKSQAFVENNILETINLAKDDLVIEQQAIFTSNAKTIILPASVANVDDVHPDCIYGYQPQLVTVRFGDQATASNYAFVRNHVLYYGTEEDYTYIMYVLKNVPTRTLNRVVNKDLQLDPFVSDLNVYALSSLDWSRITSISADGLTRSGDIQNIDFAKLKNVDRNLPKFVNRLYTNTEYRMQTFVKTLTFAYGSYSVSKTFEFGDFFTVFDPKTDSPYAELKFDKQWHKFKRWSCSNGLSYYVDETFQLGTSLLIDSALEFSANSDRCWEAYPVRFHVYDNGRDQEENITAFISRTGAEYSIEDIINNVKNNNGNTSLLSQLYMPALDLTITRENVQYQFVGWGLKKSTPTSFDGWLWNNTNSDKYLPDGALRLDASNGQNSNGTLDVYNYYALYDRVSNNLEFNLENSAFTVSKSNREDRNIFIPYSRYYQKANEKVGYMIPVMKVKSSSFYGLTNINQIIIGAAVTDIGDSAFMGISAPVTFAHVGTEIMFNYDANHPYYLSVGSRAFQNNTNLTSLTLPNATREIGDYAFAGCSRLTSLTFSGNTNNAMLHRLGSFIFRDDVVLAQNAVADFINLDTNSNGNLDQVGEGIFMNNIALNTEVRWLNTLLQATQNTVIDSSVQRIRGYAFANVKYDRITTLVINNPNIVIEANAFAFLTTYVKQIDLTQVDIDRVADDAFVGMPIDVKVKVFYSLVDYWVARFKSTVSANNFIIS